MMGCEGWIDYSPKAPLEQTLYTVLIMWLAWQQGGGGWEPTIFQHGQQRMAIDEAHAERDHSEHTEVFSASASRDACRASVPDDQRLSTGLYALDRTYIKGGD